MRENDYTQEQILDYLDLNRHFAIIIEEENLTEDFAENLKDKGIRIYIEEKDTLTLKE